MIAPRRAGGVTFFRASSQHLVMVHNYFKLHSSLRNNAIYSEMKEPYAELYIINICNLVSAAVDKIYSKKMPRWV